MVAEKWFGVSSSGRNPAVRVRVCADPPPHAVHTPTCVYQNNNFICVRGGVFKPKPPPECRTCDPNHAGRLWLRKQVQDALLASHTVRRAPNQPVEFEPLRTTPPSVLWLSDRSHTRCPCTMYCSGMSTSSN